MRPTRLNLLLADEVWVVVARMHQQHPSRQAFTSSEIVAEVRRANLTGQLRVGIQPHVHDHMVANQEPKPARYRMLFKLPDNHLRLYRPGDPAHPGRNGKTMPDRNQLPAEYHRELDWYEKVYCLAREGAEASPTSRSFIDRLSGLGKPVWAGTSADEYVAELRRGWDS